MPLVKNLIPECALYGKDWVDSIDPPPCIPLDSVPALSYTLSYASNGKTGERCHDFRDEFMVYALKDHSAKTKYIQIVHTWNCFRRWNTSKQKSRNGVSEKSWASGSYILQWSRHAIGIHPSYAQLPHRACRLGPRKQWGDTVHSGTPTPPPARILNPGSSSQSYSSVNGHIWHGFLTLFFTSHFSFSTPDFLSLLQASPSHWWKYDSYLNNN